MFGASQVRQVYGIFGIRFVVALLVLQAAAVCFACISLVLHALAAPGGYVWAALVLGVVAWAALTVLLWSGLSEQLVRLDLVRLRAVVATRVAPLAMLVVTVVCALLAAPPPAEVKGPLAIGLAAGGAGVFVACVLTVTGTSRQLRRRQRLVDSWSELLDHFSSSSHPAALERIRALIAVEAGASSRKPPFSLRGYEYPALPARPFHDSNRFEWVAELEANWQVVRDEARAVLEQSVGSFELYPASKNQRWLSFPFYRGGVPNEENCARCPETVRLIEALIPGGTVREAMFATLEPGAYLPAHVDSSTPMLTFHLGLIVPDGCGIRVGNAELRWTEGKCLILDTTFEHEAWNYGDSPRVVLLTDFWPPELTETEQSFFRRVFRAQMARQRAEST
jgi:aspartyl/asparaginyl beta-hydroxylase (cupin superfamily)